MITIVDYGMGNLRSVSKALEHLGIDSRISADPDAVAGADRLILPGVGAFGDAMVELERRGLADAVRAFARTGRPLIGICLGMQLLFDSSEESPGIPGLGLIPGTVRRFDAELKVPHMGWNTVEQRRGGGLFKDIPDGEFFYFVHSYYVDPAPDAAEAAAGMTGYGIEFPSVLSYRNFHATQFHPEKSQQRGLQMLQNFAAL